MRRRALYLYLYLYEAIPTGHHHEPRSTGIAGRPGRLTSVQGAPSMVTGTSSGTVHSLPLDLAVMPRRTGAFA